MPAHSASKDARERAYVAGIHVLDNSMASKSWMAGTSPAMTVGESDDYYPGWYNVAAPEIDP